MKGDQRATTAALAPIDCQTSDTPRGGGMNELCQKQHAASVCLSLCLLVCMKDNERMMSLQSVQKARQVMLPHEMRTSKR